MLQQNTQLAIAKKKKKKKKTNKKRKKKKKKKKRLGKHRKIYKVKGKVTFRLDDLINS